MQREHFLLMHQSPPAVHCPKLGAIPPSVPIMDHFCPDTVWSRSPPQSLVAMPSVDGILTLKHCFNNWCWFCAAGPKPQSEQMIEIPQGQSQNWCTSERRVSANHMSFHESQPIKDSASSLSQSNVLPWVSANQKTLPAVSANQMPPLYKHGMVKLASRVSRNFVARICVQCLWNATGQRIKCHFMFVTGNILSVNVQ